jgi:hypothetical protein
MGDPIALPQSFAEMPIAVRANMGGEFIRQAILGELALPTDSPLRLNSRGAYLKDVNVTGGLDLSAAKFDRPIVFEDCAIDGLIDLSSASLESLVLRGCQATGVKARGAKIGGDLIFDRGSLDNPGHYAFDGESICIGGSLLFINDFVANGAVSIAFGTIAGRVVCNGTFRNPARIVDSVNWFVPVHSALNGFGVKIGRSLAFSTRTNAGGTFRAEGFVVFANAAITDGVYLVSGSFTSGVRNAPPAPLEAVGDTASRFAIQAGSGLSLHNVQTGELLLTGLERFEGLLSLRAAVVRTIAEDGTLWRDPTTGRVRRGVALELDGFRYEAFTNSMVAATDVGWPTRLEWLKAQLPAHLGNEFRSQPFTQCAEALRRMGDSHGANMILFERERIRLSAGHVTWWEKIAGNAKGIFAGHGYKSYYAVIWALGVWLLGGVVFGIADRLGQMRPASEHVIVEESYQRTGHIPRDYEPLKPLLYSADILLPIVDIGQEKFWLPRDPGEQAPDAARRFPKLPRLLTDALDRLFGGWLPKGFYYFEIAMGWVLVTIALAGFSGHLGKGREE